jgi:hypothetical protein
MGLSIKLNYFMSKLIYIFLVVLLFSCSCAKNDDINTESALKASDFDCINDNIDKALNIKDVEAFLYKSWKLRYVATMLPSNKIDNIELKFNKDGVCEIYKDGKLSESVGFKIYNKLENNFKSVNIESQKSNSQILNGRIMICEKQLLIDQGMALDAPAYYFIAL